VGGMAASVIGMGLAAGGYLSPAAGALVQEAIDVVAVLNALRVAWDSGPLSDYGQRSDQEAGPAAAIPAPEATRAAALPD